MYIMAEYVLDEVLKMAEEGNLNAQYALGSHFYSNGQPEKAVSWWKKASDKNHPQSMFWLGVCYNNGFGVAPNKPLGIALYTEVAKMGYTDVQAHLASRYFYGEHVEKDYEKAYNWALESVRSDVEKSFTKKFIQTIGKDGLSEFILGYCLENGKGVTQNKRKALEWYQKSEGKGYWRAASAVERIAAEFR